MRTFSNKTVARLTLGYLALTVGLLIYCVFHSDAEGRAFTDLVLGFPWVLLTDDSLFGTVLFVALNSLSLYVLLLICVEAFRSPAATE